MNRKIRPTSTQQSRRLHEPQRLRCTQPLRRRPPAPIRSISRPPSRHPTQPTRHHCSCRIKDRIINRPLKPLRTTNHNRPTLCRSTEEHALMSLAINLRPTRRNLTRHPATNPNSIVPQRTPAKLRVAGRHCKQLRPRNMQPTRDLFEGRMVEIAKHLIHDMQRRQSLRPFSWKRRQRLLEFAQTSLGRRLCHHVDLAPLPIDSPDGAAS